MTRKIFRSGNSAVVSIPQESLEALGLEVGSEVEVIVDEDRGRLILRPAEAPRAWTSSSPGVSTTSSIATGPPWTPSRTA